MTMEVMLVILAGIAIARAYGWSAGDTHVGGKGHGNEPSRRFYRQYCDKYASKFRGYFWPANVDHSCFRVGPDRGWGFGEKGQSSCGCCESDAGGMGDHPARARRPLELSCFGWAGLCRRNARKEIP